MQTTRRQFLTIAGSAALAALAAPRLLSHSPYAVEAQAIPGAPSFKGAAGKSIQGPLTLNAGMAVLRAQHTGTGNFSVTFFLPAPGETAQQSYDADSFSDFALVYNEIGPIKGGAVTLVGTPGDHYLAVDSSGAFQISVEQPLPGNITTVQQTVFSGKGKDVTPYFTLPGGISSLSVQTTADSFHGWLYHIDDLGGEPITDGINVYDGRFFDFTFPDNKTSYPVNLPDSGPYLLATDNFDSTKTWTFTFQ
ncbi:MAG: hypothetical protein ACR2PL_10710 [Dehalococcoidia bacterium]